MIEAGLDVAAEAVKGAAGHLGRTLKGPRRTEQPGRSEPAPRSLAPAERKSGEDEGAEIRSQGDEAQE